MRKKKAFADQGQTLFDLSMFTKNQHPDSVDLEGFGGFDFPRDAIAIAEDTPPTHIKENLLEPVRARALETCSGADAPESAPESAPELTSLQSDQLASSSWLEEYLKGNHRYLKLWWRERGKKRSQHVIGGNIDSALVQRRRAEIESAIALKKPLAEIKKLCGFRSARHQSI